MIDLSSQVAGRALGALALGAVLGAVLTPVAIRLAYARGWLAHPRVDRWHTRTVALMGGIAIIAAFLIASLVVGAFHGPLALIVPTGAIALLVLGFIDDRRGMGPAPKLAVELVIAAAVVAAGLRFAPAAPAFVSVPLTVLWIIGVTNALNLLDNMDGLAGGTGAAIAGACAVLGVLVGATPVALLGAVLAGACLGYLPYNYRRARVFMGDAGSLPLGFLVAVLALMTGDAVAPALPAAAGILLPVLLCALPIVDTTLVTVSRIRSGRRVSQGGRDHSSHRLVYVGLGETQAVALLHAYVLAGGALAVLAGQGRGALSTTLVVAGLVAALVVWVLLLRVDPYVARESVTQAAAMEPVPAAPVMAATHDLRSLPARRTAPSVSDAREAGLVGMAAERVASAR